jgi:hypothetical protein
VESARGRARSGAAYDAGVVAPGNPSGATLYEIETEGSSLPQTPGTASGAGDFDERLRRLQRLRDDGLLTAEEFQRKRDEILGERG